MFKVYTGETVDEAIEKGLQELKLKESDVKIDVVQSPKGGLFGFGKKSAEVKLTVINPELKTHGSIDEVINRNVDPVEEAVVEEETEQPNVLESVEETLKQTAEEPVEDEATTLEHEEAKEMHEEQVEGHVTPEKIEENANNEVDSDVDSDEAADTSIEDVADKTAEYISDVVKHMDIENKTTVEVKRNEVYITFESDKSAKIIGKRGATLNALQELAQVYFNTNYSQFGLVFLDVENYREKRKEILENLALNMSKKAIRTNQPVKLEPMPSFERKIMHNVLTDINNIETHSEGQEPNRYIVITKI